MNETKTVLWRDSFDDDIIHIGTKCRITKSKAHICHVSAIHMDHIFDLFGRSLWQEINNLLKGLTMQVKLTLTIEED